MKSPLIASLLANGLAVSAGSVFAKDIPTCCSDLAESVPDIVFIQSTSPYDTIVAARWSETAILRPACVVQPKSAQDVSKALKVLVSGQCQFSVKSGGHNANPGADSINGGVSIDLGQLNTTHLADDGSFVSLGSGTNWAQAYGAFNSSDIGFLGGTCDGVGVGGVSVGGGLSIYLARRGWIVDDILNYEVVLASGSIVNANQSSNPDLFKALKGGNTNLGIVTRVDIAAFHQGPLWGGEVAISLQGPNSTRTQSLDQFSGALVNFTAGNHLDPDTTLQSMVMYSSGNQGQGVYTAFTNINATANPPSLQPLLDLPDQIELSVGPVKIGDWVHAISLFQPKGFRQVTASITFFNDYATLREIWDQTDAIYNALPQKDQIDWMFSIVPQPALQQTYASASGGNSLGLQNVNRDQIVMWLTSRWTDPSLDDMMNDAREEWVKVATAVSKKHGTFHPFVYINFAGPNQDPFCGYGAENAAFIKKMAHKYDPDGVFQTLMPGGFKISKSKCA